jgi:protein gp37
MATKIEWADYTINPVVGCTPTSAGCRNCYAERMFPRLKGMGTRLYSKMESFADIKWDTEILINELMKLAKKKHERRPRIFLCSMSDLFHEKVPDTVIISILAICSGYPQFEFMILTKRYERLVEFGDSGIKIPNNVRIGISISTNDDLLSAHALDYRFQIFVSFEPLLEEMSEYELDLIIFADVNWVIVGAETGPGHRPFDEEWALRILDKAREFDIPFFFKQQYTGNGNEKTTLLNGEPIHEFPEGEQDAAA